MVEQSHKISQNKIKFLKKSKQIYNTSSVLQDEEVQHYLKDIQTKFFIVLIDKVSNNFYFIIKNSVSTLLYEIGTQSDTCQLVNKLKEEMIDVSITISSKYNLEIQNNFKTRLIMLQLPKMHKTPTVARYFCCICKKVQYKGFVKGSYKGF